MIDPVYVESLLKFIGIQQKHWKVAVERSVLASVRAFHFLHKVRFGGLSYATRSDLNSDNSDCEQDDSKDGGVAKRKSSESRVSLTLGNTDADSSADSDAEPRSTHRSPPKARRTLSTREANAWAFITDHGTTPCPRVDKPHPASIACTRPAVAGCAWKDVAQVVRNCSCVTDWDNRKFSQDILNGDDIKNGLSVVKLVYNLRANRFQPSCKQN
jgi:hypothetical protein